MSQLVMTAAWQSSTTDFRLGHQGLSLDTESGLYYNRARMLHPTMGTFTSRDPLGYVDGMSLYQYVGSSPNKYSDPGGTDRYVGSNARLHYFIVVDEWELSKNSKGCPCWRKSGQTRYEFRLHYKTWWVLVNAAGSMLFSAAGEVYATPDYAGPTHNPIPSTPEADQWLTAEMHKMILNPPNYSLWVYDCNHWVYNWKNEGIAQTANKASFLNCD